jgi:hypothetical protein
MAPEPAAGCHPTYRIRVDTVLATRFIESSDPNPSRKVEDRVNAVSTNVPDTLSEHLFSSPIEPCQTASALSILGIGVSLDVSNEHCWTSQQWHPKS